MNQSLKWRNVVSLVLSSALLGIMHIPSVLPRRFWVGAAPSPLTVRRPALGFNSQRPALTCPHQRAPYGPTGRRLVVWRCLSSAFDRITSTKLAAQDASPGPTYAG